MSLLVFFFLSFVSFFQFHSTCSIMLLLLLLFVFPLQLYCDCDCYCTRACASAYHKNFFRFVTHDDLIKCLQFFFPIFCYCCSPLHTQFMLAGIGRQQVRSRHAVFPSIQPLASLCLLILPLV